MFGIRQAVTNCYIKQFFIIFASAPYRPEGFLLASFSGRKKGMEKGMELRFLEEINCPDYLLF